MGKAVRDRRSKKEDICKVPRSIMSSVVFVSRHFFRKVNTVNSVVSEHSVITNRFIGKIGHFSALINPVITNSGYK